MSKSLKKSASFSAMACEPLEERRLLSYSFIDLGSFGGNTIAKAVNAAGQVAGSSFLVSGDNHAFLWQNGVISDIGTLGGTTSVGNDINDLGMIVGNSQLAESTDAQLVAHAYVWQSGIMTDLGTLGGTFSSASGINNHGQIVGYAMLADGATTHGVVWENGAIYDLNSLVPANSGWQFNGLTTFAINDNGQIVGQGSINGHSHAFRLSDNDGIFGNGGAVITDLGTIGGSRSGAYSINNSGQVAGWSYARDGTRHAVRYSGSTLSDLKSLYQNSFANSINDGGQVVGGSDYRGWTLASQWHAFMWQNGKMTDLNQQLPSGSTWTLEIAYDINKSGRIVGTFLVGGQRHGFMMVPGTVSSIQSSAAAPTTFSTAAIAGGAAEVLAIDGATVLE